MDLLALIGKLPGQKLDQLMQFYDFIGVFLGSFVGKNSF